MTEMSTVEDGRVLVLPALLDLTHAAGLKTTLEEAVRSGGDLAVDASAVQRVTTPCLQVLASAMRSYAQLGGGALHFREVSPEFADTVRTLGLATMFNIPGGE